LKTQDEKEINRALERIEKTRCVDSVIPFWEKTWILHYSPPLIKKEVKELRKELDKFKELTEKK